MSYIQRGNLLSKNQIKAHLLSMEWIVKKAKKLAKEKYSSSEDQLIDQTADSLYNLNEALFCNRKVFAICVKEPASLDRGQHYYQIYSVDGLGLNHFWSLLLMDKTSNRYTRGYNFTSGAIGMSRLLDATDYIFSLLKDMGGCYTQIDLLS